MNYYICPECGGEATDQECPDCDSLGEVLDEQDEYTQCEWCDGIGYIEGYYECIVCGHVYAEYDVETRET